MANPNDVWVVLGKHLIIARHVAQRVAEELGNALVLPINPFTPAVSGGDPNPPTRVGTMRSPGTLTVTDATFGAMSREIVTSAIVTAGFQNVLIMGDHGFGQNTPGKRFPDNFDGGTLKRVAEDLDNVWQPRGTRVHYIPVDGEVDHRMIPEYLTEQKVPADIQTPVDDIAEVWSIDPEGIRQDNIPPDIGAIASPELGRKFVELKVSTILRHARNLGAVR